MQPMHAYDGSVIGHHCETDTSQAPKDPPEFRQRPPLKVIPAPPGSKLTNHQIRSTLLSMHATADTHRTYGRGSALRASLAKIATYETELSEREPAMYASYTADRDAQRAERQQRQIQPGPTEQACAEQPKRELVRCGVEGCSSLAVAGIGTPRPYCGFPAHQPEAIAARLADEARREHQPARCTAPGCRRLAVVDEGAAAPHCGAHQPAPPPAVEAARKAEAEAEASSQAEPSALDKAVEALIRKHTRGAVLDAVWEVSGRISPWR